MKPSVIFIPETERGADIPLDAFVHVGVPEATVATGGQIRIAATVICVWCRSPIECVGVFNAGVMRGRCATCCIQYEVRPA